MHSSIKPLEHLRSSETNGLILTEFAQPASFKVPKHFHECATVLFTIRGFAADSIAGRVRECKPSSILIRPAGEVHTHHYGRQGLHGLVIEIKPHRLQQLRVFSSILDQVGLFDDCLSSDLGMRLYLESRIRDSASALAIEGLLMEMLALAVRQNAQYYISSTRPHWLRQARDFIEASYTGSLSLSQVALTVGVHPAHLAEMFRKHYGCTVGQYIRQLRLDHAAREVMLSNRSMAEISVAAGFYDQSHFTRLFKRRTGRSPAAMRVLSRTPKAHAKSLELSKLD
ncbi:MAG TPA: AraC family transcriptional regulator [Pyrinomonadaceae bacterium]|nr:AraC family transcriptional regulator [Pyrinomonadaceae bacterium]